MPFTDILNTICMFRQLNDYLSKFRDLTDSYIRRSSVLANCENNFVEQTIKKGRAVELSTGNT